MARFYWHKYHEIILSLSFDPILRRRNIIRKTKPPKEVPLRLRLLKPVKGKLPVAVLKAAKELRVVQTDAGLFNYKYASDKFYAALSDKRNKETIEKLHRKECKRCPWDGKTIFPKQRKGQ